MQIATHPDTTRVLSAPGCDDLPIADIGTHLGPAMASSWLPTTDELAALILGASITLTVLGSRHPPVAMEIGTAHVGRAQQTHDAS